MVDSQESRVHILSKNRRSVIELDKSFYHFLNINQALRSDQPLLITRVEGGEGFSQRHNVFSGSGGGISWGQQGLKEGLEEIET